MSLTLHTDAGNFRAFKIIIAAKYNDVKLNIPEFDEAAVKAKSVSGKAPLLETPSGCIFESNAIARYIARIRSDTELYGSSFFESAQVDSWIDFCSHELELPVTLWLYPVFGYIPANGALTAKAKEDTARALATINAYLNDKTYLVGHKITLADITIASTLVYVFKFVADPAFRSQFGNVVRWFDTVSHQPHFISVVGNIALCENEMTSGASIAAGAAAGGNKKEKKEKAPKAEKPKAEKPKAEKPKAEKKPKEEDPEEDFDITPKEKKEEHIFKIMDKEQPSPFVMDAWKRCYSNCAGDYVGALNEFWNTFDPAGWSLWRGDYQYNEENSVLFMTSNLIGGFMQRTDEIRKWLFGTMTIRGEEKKGGMKITCYFLIRGQDIKPLIDCNTDAECYTWTKLATPVSEEDKAKVFEFWVNDTTLENEPCLDSRCFK